VLTFCINSKRGRGGHESPRLIRALGKETGEPTGTFGSHPLRTLSSHGDNAFRFTFSFNHCKNDIVLQQPHM